MYSIARNPGGRGKLLSHNLHIAMNEPRQLIVFTRYPEPYRTKTRLISALGAHGAARLQREMTRHILRWAGWLQWELSLAVEVRYDGGDEVSMRECFGTNFSYCPQGEGDLGARMARSIVASGKRGAGRIVVIGTDCPEIKPQRLLSAFDRLLTCDLVLGPASDGGYYLIGMRRYHSELFTGIDWGTPEVLPETMRRAGELSLSVSQLEMLSDVDRPEDIVVWRRARGVGV